MKIVHNTQKYRKKIKILFDIDIVVLHKNG